MLTKDLKKGTRVLLRNGWEAKTLGTAKTAAVLCEVYGYYTEMGSVYGHDIMRYQDENGNWQDITGYTPCQIKCKQFNDNMPW
jgi:hypothetical protein